MNAANLEILGTHPAYWTADDMASLVPLLDDARLASLVPLLGNASLASMLPRIGNASLARLVPLLDDARLASLVPLLDDASLARLVPLLDDASLASLVPWIDDASLARPYTQVLHAIDEGGSLDMDTWHTCETTHCLAGWIVRLAGQAGKELENKLGTAAAATLILRRSRPDAKLPNFHASDEAAMAFIKARAKEEA